MSEENNIPGNAAGDARQRRGSFTQNTFSAIFGGRSNGVSAQPNSTGTGPFPTPINTANTGRRMSITTLGLTGTSPTQSNSFYSAGRRASISTAGSDSIDENAIEDDDGPGRSAPTTPFTRRMSIGAQALWNRQGNGGSPGTSADGLNWSEQFRSRAESTVTRPIMSNSPSFTIPRAGPAHERAKSIAEMPAPPRDMPTTPQKEVSAIRKKPDAIGERMLRGEFYMD